jgi:hypothetical protein
MVTSLNHNKNSFRSEHGSLQLALDSGIFYPIRWILMDYSSTAKLHGLLKGSGTAGIAEPKVPYTKRGGFAKTGTYTSGMS